MLAILLACLAQFGSLPQGVAPAPAGIECSTCKGTGLAQQDCLVCQGSKRVDCRTCLPGPSLALELDLDCAARAPGSEASVHEALEALRKLRQAEAATFGEPVPGYARCPATCIKGKSLLNGGKPCKYCEGKGRLACPRCKKKGELRCAACDGRGRVQRICEDCLGTGRRQDPATIAADARSACPTCSGRATWACRECDEKGFVDSPCRTCNGEGRLPCAKCLGTRQKPCNKCSSTGDLSAFLGAKTSNRCNACDAKGLVPCDACDKGSVPCPVCQGKRHAPQRCRACYGTHVRLCEGCARGGFRSWELAGDALLSAGDRVGARAFFDLARERIDDHYARLASRADDAEAEAKALDKERKAQFERLDKRIAATQAPAK